MAQGSSGRIVIDVDPEFKQELYDALKQSGSTLKDWFLNHATEFCDEQRQPSLLRVSDRGVSYGARSASLTPTPDKNGSNNSTEN